jgi:hypothetical protein
MSINQLILPELVGKKFTTTGIDSLAHCKNKFFFKNFPLSIGYNYNSRGFRDNEWPADLQNAVWCVGDSFTVGLGLPFELTWPQQLQKQINFPVIIIAMDGASNQWIARQINLINSEIRPKHLIAMWSYFHRREHVDTALSDLQRRIRGQLENELEDFELFEQLILQVSADNLIHAVIPNCHESCSVTHIWNAIRGDSWPKNVPESMKELSNKIQEEIHSVHNLYSKLELLLEINQRFVRLKTQLPFVDYDQIDLARDSHHFGPETCALFCNNLLQTFRFGTP